MQLIGTQCYAQISHMAIKHISKHKDKGLWYLTPL